MSRLGKVQRQLRRIRMEPVNLVEYVIVLDGKRGSPAPYGKVLAEYEKMKKHLLSEIKD